MVCKYSVEIYTTLFITHNSIFTSPTGVAVKYCGEYVSVSVCVSVQQDGWISLEPCAIFTIFFVHVARVHGSVLWDVKPYSLAL